MTLLDIFLIFTITWFAISFILIEGADPFRPTWMNKIASSLSFVLKALLYIVVVFGVAGLVSDMGKKRK